MRFYNRHKEITVLREIRDLSHDNAQMTVITGRRRIGKTTLINHAFGASDFVYFFVARKSEMMLCDELCGIIREVLDEDIGNFTSFSRLFSVLMNVSKRRPFTLVFDEFQNLQYANPALFSEIQHVWDSNKDESKINFVVCGSVFSMMTRIFDDTAEPLYGRATHRMNLRPFTTDTLKEILADYNPHYTADDLLTFYMLTGGVAKYVEQLIIHKAYTHSKMIKSALSYGSFFISEGFEVLREEFGKEYTNYFSILQAIADGNTDRGKIKNVTNLEPGGYLDKLEKIYNLISRHRAFMQPDNSRSVRYFINDNFLTFWFRFIYKYRSAVEIDNLNYVADKVMADYPTFSGYMLERYFRQQYAETGRFNLVTDYWKGGGDEIDLIAVNNVEHQLTIAECKRQQKRISIEVLQQKAHDIVKAHQGWDITYQALSLENM